MSKKKYYIAYGSNFSVEQMAVRCPDARVVGNAILYGWQLLFKGCATIEPNPERNTPVLVWEISERDERSLDRYEGYPSFYYKKDLEVETFPLEGGEPETLTAMLARAGFSEIKTYGDQSFAPVRGGEDRIYFTARKRD